MTLKNSFVNQYTIASYFARTHLSNAVLLGANEQLLLARADLRPAQLEQAKSRVLPTQLASIIKSCWQLSGDELLGYTQNKIKVGMFRLLAERLIACKTLAEVFTHSADFYNLTGDQLRFEIKKINSLVVVSLNANFKSNTQHSSPNSLLSELILLICHRFSSWLVGQVVPLVKVEMQHAKPTHYEEYRLMYPCPCMYQCRNNALVFDTKYLHLPVVREQAELVEYLNQVPLQWFKKQSYYDTYSAKVLRLLENAVLDKESNLEMLAAKLNMTSRTLRRKLIAEGSRFQQLKDNVRRDKAISLFEQPSLSIAQISIAVGFTEMATFSRAFKHWTGVSPSTYRNYRWSFSQ
ncbi:AraC family transcriptional regulator ligand-binding domain-containing protein [Paraglaciecola sp. 25GB23A]|uniref:AraC family transcriptional regulator n=1 Tax=Paraglaciecola sp. 25GB23A TaxID=3156068 RepID=UPI0032AFB2B9